MLFYYISTFSESAVSSRFHRLTTLISLMLVFAVSGRQAVAAPRVVVSIAPLHSLVAAVMAGSSRPHLLLRGGESPHTFSLRPSDARALSGADILFWIGPPLERPLARILPNLDVSATVAMLDAPGLNVLSNRPLDAAGHEQTNGEPHTDPASIDPHIWLSPTNAAIITDAVAQALTQADPIQAGLYRSNAAQLKDRLTALDRRLAAQLADVSGSYAVFHDAYQYFERHYSLRPVAAVNTHPERSPGAAHLHELRATLATHGVRCLFSEPQFQPRLVAMLSEGRNIRHAVLDPLGSEIPPGPEAYFQMMHAIADTLEQCMQGDSAP